MEFRVINPELLAVAHGDAGRIAFGFAAKFIRALEPDLAGADNRLVQHLDVFFLLKVRLDLRRGRAFFLDPAEQRFEIGGRERLGMQGTQGK